VWRHLCVQVLHSLLQFMMILLRSRGRLHLYVTRQLTTILLRNRGQDLCVQESQLARKGVSRNINLGNLSTQRLQPLLIRSLGIFNLHPNVAFCFYHIRRRSSWYPWWTPYPPSPFQRLIFGGLGDGRIFGHTHFP
jgi:hypothetical protein